MITSCQIPSIEQEKVWDVELISAQCQGHFIDSEGCTELPEVWQAASIPSFIKTKLHSQGNKYNSADL